MSVAYINPEVLAWARGRAGLLPDELQSFHRKYVEWEQGTAKPTFRQAQELAKKLHVPFGFLYLSRPPEEKPLTIDLRTFRDEQHRDFSLDLRDVISDAKRKQEWYRDYLIEGGAEPLGFVGKYNVSSGVNSVAEDIRKTLQLSFAEREGFTKQQFLGVLTDKAEQAGVLVLRNGKVGANTHYTDTAKADFLAVADSWLIAKAKSLKLTIVTEERSHPQKRNKIYIPDICGIYEIPYTNTVGLIRALGGKFG